ncbi:MAG: PorV/PorQ family protein [Elusimicrobia bacterium]|nr:PorV/PorQ family protein [Elusimicrobiota bacterium]
MAGGSTASFLKIGVGARPIGMGNAFTAIANDINAIAWNPAGLSQLSKREVGLMHAELFADTRYDFLGYAHPTSIGTFGLGINYLSQAKIESRSADRSASGSFGASDMALNIAYGRPIPSGTRLGINFKYLQSQISDVKAQGWAVDLGALHRTPIAGLNLGLAVQNLGPGLKFIEESSPLPLTFATGFTYHLHLGMALALDLKHMPHDKRTTVSIGTEYALFSALTLRAGYLGALAAQGQKNLRSTEGLAGLGTGFGLKLRGYGIDYAFTPMGELGNAQRISLSASF